MKIDMETRKLALLIGHIVLIMGGLSIITPNNQPMMSMLGIFFFICSTILFCMVFFSELS